MLQNQTTVRRPEAPARLNLAKESLQAETERTLSEIAQVLHFTRKVKKAILDEKAAKAAK
jgi:hypothetical protein